MKLFPHLIFLVCGFLCGIFSRLRIFKTVQNNTFNHLRSKPKSAEFRIFYVSDDYREAVFRLLFSFFIWWTLISTSLLILHFFVSALINVSSHFYEPECRVDTDCSQQYQYGYSKNAKARFKIESDKNLRYNRSIVFILKIK